METPMPTLAAVTLNASWSVGWGTLALVNANLAQAKARSGAAWFLLSLVLGPVATLLLALLEPPAGA
jgi:hypothetical protein